MRTDQVAVGRPRHGEPDRRKINADGFFPVWRIRRPFRVRIGAPDPIAGETRRENGSISDYKSKISNKRRISGTTAAACSHGPQPMVGGE